MVQSAFFEGLSAVWHLDWRGRKVEREYQI